MLFLSQILNGVLTSGSVINMGGTMTDSADGDLAVPPGAV